MRAITVHQVDRITLVIPQDLDWQGSRAFAEVQRSAGPEVVVDVWTLSDLRRLLSEDPGTAARFLLPMPPSSDAEVHLQAARDALASLFAILSAVQAVCEVNLQLESRIGHVSALDRATATTISLAGELSSAVEWLRRHPEQWTLERNTVLADCDLLLNHMLAIDQLDVSRLRGAISSHRSAEPGYLIDVLRSNEDTRRIVDELTRWYQLGMKPPRELIPESERGFYDEDENRPPWVIEARDLCRALAVEMASAARPEPSALESAVRTAADIFHLAMHNALVNYVAPDSQANMQGDVDRYASRINRRFFLLQQEVRALYE
jgi:hypothetical protein